MQGNTGQNRALVEFSVLLDEQMQTQRYRRCERVNLQVLQCSACSYDLLTVAISKVALRSTMTPCRQKPLARSSCRDLGPLQHRRFGRAVVGETGSKKSKQNASAAK